MTNKEPLPVWRKPLLQTSRIEVKCTEPEKEEIYKAAFAVGKPVTRYVVEAALHYARQINSEGTDDE